MNFESVLICIAVHDWAYLIVYRLFYVVDQAHNEVKKLTIGDFVPNKTGRLSIRVES